MSAMRDAQFLILLVSLSGFLLNFTGQAHSNPLNNWNISCGVDKGAFERRGNTRVFKTSSKHCVGGSYNQRAEISTDRISPKHKGAYLFSTTFTMWSDSNERFDIFQIHDARNWCAPPLKLRVLGDGRLDLDSEFKLSGKNCKGNPSLRGKASSARITRDGETYHLEVMIDFDGKGGFQLWVKLDGKMQITGTYEPPAGGKYFKSKKFYLKHGVYSKRVFQYKLASSDMSVKKIK